MNLRLEQKDKKIDFLNSQMIICTCFNGSKPVQQDVSFETKYHSHLKNYESLVSNCWSKSNNQSTATRDMTISRLDFIQKEYKELKFKMDLTPDYSLAKKKINLFEKSLR